jgi:hypothetical protein
MAQFAINNVTQAEGNAGTTAYTFTVSLDTASAQTTFVSYATADGTALAGSDYAATSGTLTFMAGETSKTVTVLVNGDTVFEQDQTFFLNLTGPVNATIADSQGTGTITNDDAAPNLAVNDFTVSEAGGTGTFTLTRTGATEVPISVDYATADGTAHAITDVPGTPDYTAKTGTLTFAPSLAATATQTFTVALTNDNVYEAVEQATVNLSNASGATISDAQGLLTITDDDAAPIIAIGDVTVSEATGLATFTVTLTGPTALAISVDYTTADGTAVSVSGGPGTPDYTAATGTLTFAPSSGGTQTLTVSVPVNNDSVLEATEQFAVNLSNPTNGASIADSQGIGTITNDDAQPTFSINNVTQAEGNAGTTAYTFTVSLSAANTQTASVSYVTADGTALAGSDYAATSGTLTFMAGETSKTVTVLVNGDTTSEANETFSVNLSGPVNATIGTATGSGTIVDDEAQTPSTPDLIASSDTGTSATDNLTSITTPTFTGTAAPGTTVTLYNGATVVGSGMTSGGGTWSITSTTLSEGSHTITATAAYSIGNASPQSGALSITIDTTSPAAPTLVLTSDTGSSSTDKITSNPAIAYSASAAGDNFLYKVDGGNFSSSAPAFPTDHSADGVHTVSVVERDAAGNTSAESVLTFTLDTIAPAAPSITLTSDTGASPSDKITSNGAVTYTPAEAGGILLFKADGATVFTTTQPIFTTNGVHTVTALQQDVAGNSGAASSLTFTLEPDAPVVSFAPPHLAVSDFHLV